MPIVQRGPAVIESLPSMIDWSHWHNEPFLIGGLIFLGWLYAIGIGPYRARLEPGAVFPKGKAFSFYTGLVIFYLAVGSPLDQVGERFLLSAHMIQHQLLIYPAAVLFLNGIPSWLIAPVTDRPATRGLLRILFHPIICVVIYAFTLTVWHAPQLYDLALRNKNIHVLEHLMFFGAALFYWWPMLSPSRMHPRRQYGTLMLYFLSATIAMTPIFAFIAFSDNVLYPTYEYAPRLFENFTPVNDQLMGAAIMKFGDLTVTGIVLIYAFYRWYRVTESDSGRNSISRKA